MIWDQGTIDLVLAAMVIEVCDQADAALWQREHHGGEDEIERARRNPPPATTPWDAWLAWSEIVTADSAATKRVS